ncbi:hypothetical protein [Niveispirillum sp. KHB5.9]|uniref:hypothetical protein n=1 Tax=Niveispirillum sp. KHB5.9 TaxID=3400269 RepID=UPI003A836F25
MDDKAQIGLTARPPYLSSSPGTLILLAGLPLLLAGWALLAPDIVLSDHNVLDLLFNLSGAWQFQSGRVQHVDFHDAIGPLNFLLTLAGFQIVGFKASAFLVGQLLIAMVLFGVATAAAYRRLPLAASVVFVLFVTLLAMMPTNVGQPLNAFTFAMAYNRYGWSAISILCLILFIQPRPSRAGDVVDMGCALLLLLVMFYLKITYFLVGIGALVLALLISSHVRVRWRAWSVMVLLALGNAIAPHSHGYLADIHWAILSDLPRTGLRRLLVSVLRNGAELSIYGCGLIVATWLWQQGRATAALPVAMLFLIGAAIILFSQNTQEMGLPLGVVTLFLLYGALPPLRNPSGWVVPAVLLVMPAMTALAAAGTIASYFILAVPSDRLLIAEVAQARGIAVPLRAEGENDLRSQTVYLASVLDAASLFAPDRHPPGRIRVVDRVNPLPFMLGFPPPHGGDVFWEPTAPPRPVEEMLGDADYVLVPTKFSSAPALTRAAQKRFAPYLQKHFMVREETEYWILYTRQTVR